MDEDKHPCLKQDSNPRPRRPNDQDLLLRQRGHLDRRHPSAETGYIIVLNWIQVRDKRRPVVNTVMNFGFMKDAGFLDNIPKKDTAPETLRRC
jgi:hypothetical protein